MSLPDFDIEFWYWLDWGCMDTELDVGIKTLCVVGVLKVNWVECKLGICCLFVTDRSAISWKDPSLILDNAWWVSDLGVWLNPTVGSNVGSLVLTPSFRQLRAVTNSWSVCFADGKGVFCTIWLFNASSTLTGKSWVKETIRWVEPPFVLCNGCVDAAPE